MKRRTVLGLGAASVGAALASSLGRRRALAFGEVPKPAEAVMLPAERRVQSVLEVFLYGGVSQYESFYTVPELGESTGLGWHAFSSTPEFQDTMDACGISGEMMLELGEDSESNLVRLGPYAAPLHDRPDLTERLRLLVTSHDLLPHEAAVPLVMGGRRLGQPELASLGAHVQRYFHSQTDELSKVLSFVLQSSLQPARTVTAAAAAGRHPPSARPLVLKVDAAGELTTLLQRQSLGSDRQAYDALVAQNVERYRQRLTFQGEILRSRNLDDYANATSALQAASQLAEALEPDLFEPLPGSSCGFTNESDATGMSLRLATHLLTHPVRPVRHVMVIDSGLDPAADAGGYDTHTANTVKQATNLTSVLRHLANQINRPGESDPGKLNLDRTLIIVNTEFGRTPDAQGAGGRGHWPTGYPVLMLGGPVRADNAGVSGGIDASFRATQYSSPAENCIAVLLALGIYPFAPEAFNVADVPGMTNELEALQLVSSKVWGLG